MSEAFANKQTLKKYKICVVMLSDENFHYANTNKTNIPEKKLLNVEQNVKILQSSPTKE